MDAQSKCYRVTSDFPEAERQMLAALCRMDFRPPAEQIRWLVASEAARRGLLSVAGMNNRAGHVLADTSAVAA